MSIESARPLAGVRIGLLTASASRLGGGVFEAVVAHAAMLRGLGAEPVVFALADAQSEVDRARFAPTEVKLARRSGPALFGYSPQLIPMLRDSALDCLHLHGIWMYPSRAGGVWARGGGLPYLISPHGMLDPWITGRGRWKKALARAGYERSSWCSARAFHALTAREAQDIARETGREDSIIIANAGPLRIERQTALRPPNLLYLGRIHPKKNLGALIAAWCELDGAGLLVPGAELVIAGWGDADDVAELVSLLDPAPKSIRYVGPMFGAAKEQLLEGSRFLILPSHSEGLPMVILEAWAKGTPTLMSAECNLPQGFAAGAALDCGYDAPAIAKAISVGLARDEAQWLAMSAAAHDLAAGPFSPGAIARQWEDAYAQLLNRTQRHGPTA